MRKALFFLFGLTLILLASSASAQSVSRDLIPTEIDFYHDTGGIVEYNILYSVNTALPDSGHVTSAVVSVNGIPQDTIPLLIDPYQSSGKMLPGPCWGIGGGTGACPTRTCLGGFTCVDVFGLYCTCDILGGLLALQMPLQTGDLVAVSLDPMNFVPENYEDNNSIEVVFFSCFFEYLSDSSCTISTCV